MLGVVQIYIQSSSGFTSKFSVRSLPPPQAMQPVMSMQPVIRVSLPAYMGNVGDWAINCKF